MKYSIGYFLPDEFCSVYEIVKDYKDKVSEVYFSYADEPGGRSAVVSKTDEEFTEKKEYQIEEIKYINKDFNVKTALLFNANCYGKDAFSNAFYKRIFETCSLLKKEVNLSSVTTTSPFVAKVVKQEFGEEIKVRASVNMRIGTVKAMQYLEDFNGFYMQREFNRDFNRIKELKTWCDENGKTLHILANSGCLNYCAYQTYHDNTVAHEEEIVKNDNYKLKYPSPCWDFMEKRVETDGFAKYLQGSFIRPEDIHNYEEFFSEAKLATRIHLNPKMVVKAYAEEKYIGNIMDLTEPSYSSLFKNFILDNKKFPSDWFEKTKNCTKECHKCNYCKEVAEKIKTDISKYL